MAKLKNVKVDKTKQKTKKKTKKKIAKDNVEEIYKEKTLHEHIETIPDSYVGSVKVDKRDICIYDSDDGKLTHEVIDYVGAFYKIFDEIIVNARDHTIRDKTCKNIKINIDIATGYITVWNDGNGIPVEFHKKSKKYVPHMIFGTLLTSSNYDQKGKTTGGKNGYGAKLTNIYSKEFIVDTVDKKNKKRYTQRFADNMHTVEDPVIVDVSKTTKPYTSIRYLPDFAKFGMENLTVDMYNLLIKRGYDLAACTSDKVKVWVNGKEIKCRKLPDYIKMFYKTSPKLVYEEVNSRWKIGAVFDKDCGFNQVSFVNGICTIRGGTHVNHVMDQIVKKVRASINSQAKHKELNIKRSLITDNIAIYIDAVVEDPNFDSQTKETLNTSVKDYGSHKDSRCVISDEFIKDLMATGLEKEVIKYAEFKAQDKLKTTDGKKEKRVNVQKLDDAHKAGSRMAHKCRLFITEGDSAKTFAVSGFSIIGKEYYGVYPIRGKFLNVRTATNKQLLTNNEFKDLKMCLGLKQGMDYSNPKNFTKLRYGGIIILTDQDVDGSHIKGLLMNMLATYWPSLLKVKGFIQTINTPIVKAWKKSDKKKKKPVIFDTLADFDAWQEKKSNAKGADNISRWDIKYYKGLGTSTDKEAKELFRDFYEKILTFVEGSADTEDESDGDESDAEKEYVVEAESDEDDESESGDDKSSSKDKANKEDDEISTESGEETVLSEETDYHFNLAFNKNFANKRKVWLSKYKKDDILQYDEKREIKYEDFVNKDLKHFSNYDNIRSIPNIMDGFKPSQRKIMYTMFNAKKDQEMKVAQWAGKVSLETSYHHGEASLQGTIVGMAQNFVGSNNINLLSPNGNFGYRAMNGKDHASPRYIFTQLESITRKIFRPEDEYEGIVNYINDEGISIEPNYYLPILPTILINGANGIGTGYSTTVYTFNPQDITTYLKAKLQNKATKLLTPWFKGFKGTVEPSGPRGENKYVTRGVYNFIGNGTVEVTEIPIGKSIEQYKNFLDTKLPKNKDDKSAIVQSVVNDSLNHKVRFLVKFKGNTLQKLIKISDAPLIKFLKLEAPLSLNNLHLYNHKGEITKYDCPEDIINKFYNHRLEMYRKRRQYMIDMLKNHFDLINYKIKYIKAVMSEEIKVKGRTYDQVIKKLGELGYPKLHSNHLAEESQRSYQYLTSIGILSQTKDKIKELENEMAKRKDEYDDYKDTTVEQRWMREILEFEKEYKRWLPESIELLEEDDEDEDVPKGKKGKGKGKGKAKAKGKKAPAKKTKSTSTKGKGKKKVKKVD